MRKHKMIAILVLLMFISSLAGSGAMAKNVEPKISINQANDGSVEVTLKFKDLNEALWALKQITKMRAANIISGYEDGSFKPNKPVTRAEAVVLTMRAAGFQNEIEQTVAESVYLPFKDAKSIPVWARKAVALAVQKGYLETGGSGNFQPEKAASREWAFKLIAKALGLQPMDLPLPFKDADKISPDAAGYVAAVVYNHLISGFPDGTFQPNKPVTRAEIAVILGLSTDEMPIPGKIDRKIKGTVMAVSTEVYSGVYSGVYTQGTITIKIGCPDQDEDEDEDEPGLQKVVTFPVAKDALIYLDEKAAALNEIATGSRVKAVVNRNGVIIFLEVEPVLVKGVVQSVYAPENKLTIIKRGHPKILLPPGQKTAITYQVAANATIIINGVKVELAKLLPGDVVRLTLNAQEQVIFVKAVRFIKVEKVDKKKVKENVRDKEKDKAKEKAKDQDKNREKDKLREQDKFKKRGT